MKKILLVLMMIFLGHSAFAGIDCWEEISLEHSDNPVSNVKDILPSGSRIVKVATKLRGSSGEVIMPQWLTGAQVYYYYSPGYTKYAEGTITGVKLKYAPKFYYHKQYGNYCWYHNDPETYNGSYKDEKRISNTGEVKYCGLSSAITTSQFRTSSDYDYHYASAPHFTSGYDIEVKIGGTTYTYNTSNRGPFSEGLFNAVGSNPHFVHTFCTLTSGGGGGAVGAAVNYIIKAD